MGLLRAYFGQDCPISNRRGGVSIYGARSLTGRRIPSSPITSAPENGKPDGIFCPEVIETVRGPVCMKEGAESVTICVADPSRHSKGCEDWCPGDFYCMEFHYHFRDGRLFVQPWCDTEKSAKACPGSTLYTYPPGYRP